MYLPSTRCGFSPTSGGRKLLCSNLPMSGRTVMPSEKSWRGRRRSHHGGFYGGRHLPRPAARLEMAVTTCQNAHVPAARGWHLCGQNSRKRGNKMVIPGLAFSSSGSVDARDAAIQTYARMQREERPGSERLCQPDPPGRLGSSLTLSSPITQRKRRPSALLVMPGDQDLEGAGLRSAWVWRLCAGFYGEWVIRERLNAAAVVLPIACFSCCYPLPTIFII